MDYSKEAISNIRLNFNFVGDAAFMENAAIKELYGGPLTLDEQWVLRDCYQDKRNAQRAIDWSLKLKVTGRTLLTTVTTDDIIRQ